MKVEQVNPFLESTQSVFGTMLGTEVQHGTVQKVECVGGSNVLLVVIGMTGEVRGAVAITYPFQTAVNLANTMLFSDKKEPDAEVSDTVAEITNMIAGSAKAHISRPDGPPVQLGLPVVIRDTEAHLDYPAMSSWVVMPFESALGEFTIFVSFEEKPSS